MTEKRMKRKAISREVSASGPPVLMKAEISQPEPTDAKCQPFKECGNYIPVHRLCFDLIMPSLSPNAWKVLCLIVRKTDGWGKHSDPISYSQLMAGTGIKGTATLRNALMELRGLSPAKDKRGEWQPNGRPAYVLASYAGDMMTANSYSLNREVEVEWDPRETES